MNSTPMDPNGCVRTEFHNSRPVIYSMVHWETSNSQPATSLSNGPPETSPFSAMMYRSIDPLMHGISLHTPQRSIDACRTPGVQDRGSTGRPGTGSTARGGAPRWDRTLTIRDWRPASGCVCGTVSQEGFMLMARRGARNTGVIKQHRSLVLLRSTCDDTRVDHQDGFPIGNFIPK